MLYKHDLPKRVRVLIIGGGIHGVGVLHDLVSRDLQDVFLVEKNTLAKGTSSKSTKLIHGGLRYLKRFSDFNLVAESLRERRLLLNLAPDIVHPLELLFPIMKKGGEKSFIVKAGLTLYDKLAGKSGIRKHRIVPKIEAEKAVPLLDVEKFKKIYSFWDGQTDDFALVHRVAASAVAFGGKISENCEAIGMRESQDGWEVEVRNHQGAIQKISALYVINCLGPWANKFLEDNGIVPKYKAISNKGVHLILPDKALKAGLFLQSPVDSRIFFLLPWKGYTLLGTTEDVFNGNPDQVQVEEKDVDYLLNVCNPYLKHTIEKSEIIQSFAGLRWLVHEKSKTISMTSREHLLGEQRSGRGLLITIYGGKLTSYRTLAEAIGDRVLTHFGEFRKSNTSSPKLWNSPGSYSSHLRDDIGGIIERFS